LSEEENLRFVRELWLLADEGGVEAALEQTEPDVEWRLHLANGQVLTSAELLRFFREYEGQRELLEAKPYSFHTNGDRVLASGSFRLRGPDRLSEFQIHWVSEFEDGTLVRATSFAKRSQALEAIGLSESEAT
jgi:ketosteroid isomerase-like protein